MKTIHLLKTAGSIACVAFALNATAQTSASAPPASSESIGQHIDDSFDHHQGQRQNCWARRT